MDNAAGHLSPPAIVQALIAKVLAGDTDAIGLLRSPLSGVLGLVPRVIRVLSAAVVSTEV